MSGLGEVAPVRPDERFDEARLADYLRGRLPGADAPPAVLQFPSGHSNLTYLLSYGAREYVLRRPPLGPLAPRAHDMGREYRVLSRLCEAFPPAPRAFLFCEDSSVIGAPFVILERRRGIVIRDAWPAELDESEALRRRISESMIDTLAALHRVDFAALGLANLGKPLGFVRRQLEGWTDRWHRAKIEDLAALDELVGWLDRTLPESGEVTLLHNDFKLDNVMLAPEDAGRVTSVFDWEMCTLGDPLIDLGITLSYWTPAHEGPGARRRITPTSFPGFLSREEVIARYAKGTGLNVDRIDWYEAFALFKMAVVLQQIFIRWHRGQTKDDRFAGLGGQVPPLIERARQVFLQGAPRS